MRLWCYSVWLGGVDEESPAVGTTKSQERSRLDHDTGLKHAVATVWRISRGMPMGLLVRNPNIQGRASRTLAREAFGLGY